MSVFFIAAPKSRSEYIGPRSTIHRSGPHDKYPTLIPCIYSHKQNLDALLKVGVIIKVVVFRALYCVVARIALGTDCCCWSIHRVRQQLIDDSIIKNRDLLHKYLVVPITTHTHVRRKSIGNKKIISRQKRKKRGIMFLFKITCVKPKQALIALIC